MDCLRTQRRLKTFLTFSAHLSRLSKPRTALLPTLPHIHRTHAFTAETLPSVTRPSLWHSIVPKFLRTSQASKKSVEHSRAKEWNPATFFIVIFMLIGSNAIQMIALRHDYINFSRKADAKIGLLKEVIGRVQRGEEVDVEGLLGTGDKEKEGEWEDALREIEEADRLWQSKAKNKTQRKANREAKETQAAQELTETTPNDADTSTTTSLTDVGSDETTASGATRPGFY